MAKKAEPAANPSGKPFSKGKSRKFSYADYLTWPDEERWEIIEGKAFSMTPSPGSVHQQILVNLIVLFGSHLKGKKCKVLAAPMDVRLSHDNVRNEEVFTIVQPDFMIVCDSRKIESRGIKGSPDLIIEIVSPSTASQDYIGKLRLYERHKVREYWIIHPTDRIAIVFKLDEKGNYGEPENFSENETVEVGILNGFKVALSEIFPS